MSVTRSQQTEMKIRKMFEDGRITHFEVDLNAMSYRENGGWLYISPNLLPLVRTIANEFGFNDEGNRVTVRELVDEDVEKIVSQIKSHQEILDLEDRRIAAKELKEEIEAEFNKKNKWVESEDLEDEDYEDLRDSSLLGEMATKFIQRDLKENFMEEDDEEFDEDEEDEADLFESTDEEE